MPDKCCKLKSFTKWKKSDVHVEMFSDTKNLMDTLKTTVSVTMPRMYCMTSKTSQKAYYNMKLNVKRASH